MVPSWKTKEFWLAVAAFVVSVVVVISSELSTDPNGAAAIVSKIAGVLGTMLTALGYGGIRTMQKANDLRAAVAEKSLSPLPKP